MKNRRPLSAGTIFTLVLTALVTAGSVIVLLNMRIGVNAAMDVSHITLSEPQNTASNQTLPEVSGVIKSVVTVPPVIVSQPTPTPETPTVQNTRTLKISAGGLVTLGKEISQSCLTSDKQNFDFSGLFSALSEHLCDDLNIFSLGGSLNGTTAKYSDTVFPSNLANAMYEAGFDTALLNSGNVLNEGADGLNSTAAQARASGIAPMGVQTENALSGVFQLNGIKVALLGYTSRSLMSSKSRANLEKAPGLVSLYDPETMAQDIAAARQAGAELVIVGICWGKADAEQVTKTQKADAKKLADAGADIILGFNTEGVLPVEMVAGDTGRQALCAYSMGTLLSADRSSSRNVSGMLLHVSVSVSNGYVSFDRIDYTPTYIMRQKSGSRYVYRVLCADEEAPADMEEKQRTYMGNALKRINTLMKDAPLR